MSGRMVTFSLWAGAFGALSAAASAPALHAQEQVQVVVTAVPNPVAAGTCAGIWAEVRNAQNQRLIELNGMPLHSRSYDFSVSSAPGVGWRDNDPASGYLCVQAGAPVASIQVMATVRSTPFSGATIVAIQGGGAPPVASANPQAAAGYPAGAAGGPQPTYAPPTNPQAGYAQPGAVQPRVRAAQRQRLPAGWLRAAGSREPICTDADAGAWGPVCRAGHGPRTVAVVRAAAEFRRTGSGAGGLRGGGKSARGRCTRVTVGSRCPVGTSDVWRCRHTRSVSLSCGKRSGRRATAAGRSRREGSRGIASALRAPCQAEGG